MSAPTIRNLIDDWAERALSKRQRRNLTSEDREALEAMLQAREDGIKDFLNLAGAQFGMYPFIVAEAITQSGLGTPLSEGERVAVRAAYVQGMQALEAAIEEQRRRQSGEDTN